MYHKSANNIQFIIQWTYYAQCIQYTFTYIWGHVTECYRVLAKFIRVITHKDQQWLETKYRNLYT